MKLNELLNKKVDYEVQINTHEDFVAVATIGGRNITFKAEYRDTTDDWLINFAEVDEKKRAYGKTGSGNELEVFAMVKDCILEVIKLRKPRQLRFSASIENGKDNRASLYRKLLDRFKVPGYEVNTKKSGESETFRIVRNETE